MVPRLRSCCSICHRSFQVVAYFSAEITRSPKTQSGYFACAVCSRSLPEWERCRCCERRGARTPRSVPGSSTIQATRAGRQASSLQCGIKAAAVAWPCEPVQPARAQRLLPEPRGESSLRRRPVSPPARGSPCRSPRPLAPAVRVQASLQGRRPIPPCPRAGYTCAHPPRSGPAAAGGQTFRSRARRGSEGAAPGPPAGR